MKRINFTKYYKWLNFLIIGICIFLGLNNLCAQTNSAVIFEGQATEKAVLLRWQYSNYHLLDYSQKNGVVLTKIWNRDKKQLFKRDTIFPVEINAISKNSQNDIYIELAEQVLKSGNDEKRFGKNLFEKIEIENDIFFATNIAASASPEAARILALGYTDKDIKKGESIFYSLQVLGVDSLSSQYVVRLNSDDKISRQVIEIDFYNAIDKEVSITWNYRNYEEDYFAYILEKSDDNGKNYKKTSETIFFPLTTENPRTDSDLATIQDSVLENYKEYYYRLRGVDIFGQIGPPSEVLKITSLPPPLPVNPAISSVYELDNRRFQIDWHLQAKYESKIKYFRVLRSDDPNENFELISDQLNVQRRTFIDENPLEVNFYRVEIVDENDYVLSSLAVLGQLNDKYPPAKPMGLNGAIDTTGEVRLSWIANTENDLDGYHIFYSNTKFGEYSILTSGGDINDTFYIDSIYVMTLADKIYYKIMAIDYRGNQSEYSDILSLDRPDLIPPTKAVFKQSRQYVDHVEIHYTLSSSRDLVSSVLQRKSTNMPWESINSTSERGLTLSYIDTSMNCKELYHYRIIGTDDADLQSISDTLQLRCIDSGKRKPITSVEIDVNSDKNAIELNWNYNHSIPAKSIMIYRSRDDGKMMKIKQFWSNDIDNSRNYSYIDKDVKEKESYKYYIVMRFDDNGFAKSEITQEIRL